MKQRITVVGAGWAGLSCASHLLSQGVEVSLLEAAPQAGGRARSAGITLNQSRIELDNGQHMLIGAYRETLGLIERCRTTQHLRRLPLQFVSPEMTIERRGPGRLGLLWGILRGRGVTTNDRLALLRVGLYLARRQWTGFAGKTVSDLLTEARQPETLINNMWRPLCVAALNTEPSAACAQTFVNVLRDALFTDGDSSDFLVATVPLGQLLPEPLLENLIASGLDYRPSTRVAAIEQQSPESWSVQLTDSTLASDGLVIATPWHVSAELLREVLPASADALKQFNPEPIRTVYMGWMTSAAQPMIELSALAMLLEDHDQGWHGQWIFDRGIHGHQHVAAVVVSAAGSIDTDNAALTQSVARQVATQCRLRVPDDAVCVNEKRATFLCTPDRPVVTEAAVNGEPLPGGLALAGDYCLHRYPSTIEAAVISGQRAAHRLLTALSSAH